MVRCAPRDLCIMLPLSQRVQPGVWTLPIRHCPSERLSFILPSSEVLASWFKVLPLPPPFSHQDAFQVGTLLLQMRCAFPSICGPSLRVWVAS